MSFCLKVTRRHRVMLCTSLKSPEGTFFVTRTASGEVWLLQTVHCPCTDEISEITTGFGTSVDAGETACLSSKADTDVPQVRLSTEVSELN